MITDTMQLVAGYDTYIDIAEFAAAPLSVAPDTLTSSTNTIFSGVCTYTVPTVLVPDHVGAMQG